MPSGVLRQRRHRGARLGWVARLRILEIRSGQMRPVNGFAAAVIEAATGLAVPVSTTHVIAATVIGRGSTRQFSAVRWAVARSIILAWSVTFPFCGLPGAGFYKRVRLVIESRLGPALLPTNTATGHGLAVGTARSPRVPSQLKHSVTAQSEPIRPAPRSHYPARPTGRASDHGIACSGH